LLYEQPHQESGFCCFSFARYLQKCVTHNWRALYGDAMFVLEGHKLGGRKITKTSLSLSFAIETKFLI